MKLTDHLVSRKGHRQDKLHAKEEIDMKLQPFALKAPRERRTGVKAARLGCKTQLQAYTQSQQEKGVESWQILRTIRF